MKKRTTRTSTVAGKNKPQNWRERPEFAANFPGIFPDKTAAYAIHRQSCKTPQAELNVLTPDINTLKTEPPEHEDLPGEGTFVLEPPAEAPVDGTGAFYLPFISNQFQCSPQQLPNVERQACQAMESHTPDNYYPKAVKGKRSSMCPCCDSDMQGGSLQAHLTVFHKISKEFARGLVMRRELIERIITTRGPLFCGKCSHSLEGEEMMSGFNRADQGMTFIIKFPGKFLQEDFYQENCK